MRLKVFVDSLFDQKKDIVSTPILIIWSIIGLKWAAYMTIPFIIALFKWTNYMMALSTFPLTDVLQSKYQSLVIYSSNTDAAMLLYLIGRLIDCTLY